MKKLLYIVSYLIPVKKYRKYLKKKYQHAFYACEYEYPVYLSKQRRINKNSFIGKYSYVINSSFHAPVKIGRYCSVASGVNIAPPNHPINLITSHTILYSNAYFENIHDYCALEFKKNNSIKINDYGKYAVEIGNDVWIGLNATILSGVKIGDGAVIGAGAVVTKDVPPYAVVGGVPGKIIKYRFNPDIIKKLLSLKWWDIDLKDLKDIDFSTMESAINGIEKIK